MSDVVLAKRKEKLLGISPGQGHLPLALSTSIIVDSPNNSICLLVVVLTPCQQEYRAKKTVFFKVYL